MPSQLGQPYYEALRMNFSSASFETILGQLATSVAAQVKVTQLALDKAEEKDDDLPGVFPTKVMKLIKKGDFISILSVWDKDIAKQE